MLVLFETPAGFVLFKVLDEGKFSKVDVIDHFGDFAKKIRRVFDDGVSGGVDGDGVRLGDTMSIGRAQVSRPGLRRLHKTERAKRTALALDKDEDDDVTSNDVFFHVYTKDRDGVTFIDSRSARCHAELVMRREEHIQATPDQPIDEDQLYYDAAGDCPKGLIYGLGSHARRNRRYVGLGSSMFREPMVRCLEFNAIISKLAQFEAFVQSQLGNAHGLWREHLSGTAAAVATISTTSRASPAGWDGFGSFTGAATRR
ncbi:hypothetical protein Scep_019136 [Stephania cephalantha]|uniref:Nucleolar protein 58/56 N-terminal domain-containing protein n=1 Tax=Stephania cephalantha TaxID=152367 RepID=A0AAP0IAS4_9MAGN